MRLPPGFRFHPTDEELVVQYLRRKASSFPLPAAVIPEINLGKYDPWDLPGCRETERYFFNLQEAKYLKGNRSNRATRSGYWKATGRDRTILGSKGNEIVGMKKVLAFHQGKPPYGIRTRWIMHEYRLTGPESIASSTSLHRKNSTQPSLVQGKDWVVCRIFMKRAPKILDGDISEYDNNSQVRNDQVGFMDMMNNDGDLPPQSPSTSCITDMSNEECGNGEEASSKLIASSP